MHCPKCAGKLKEIVFKKISIDQCEDCGVPLSGIDAGELEAVAAKEESGWLSKFLGR